MKTSLRIQSEPIDETALNHERQVSASSGAVITFLGYVRGQEGESRISALDYEAFVEMAEHQFQKLFSEAGKRWPLESIRLVHRIGVVKVQEPSLYIEVIAPHRREAFAAAQWIIDEMKRVVPIWKRPV